MQSNRNADIYIMRSILYDTRMISCFASSFLDKCVMTFVLYVRPLLTEQYGETYLCSLPKLGTEAFSGENKS